MYQLYDVVVDMHPEPNRAPYWDAIREAIDEEIVDIAKENDELVPKWGYDENGHPRVREDHEREVYLWSCINADISNAKMWLDVKNEEQAIHMVLTALNRLMHAKGDY